MFWVETLRAVAERLFAFSYESAMGNVGANEKQQGDVYIDKEPPDIDIEVHLQILCTLLGRVHGAWGISVEDVLDKMYPRDASGTFLHNSAAARTAMVYLFLGCMGHGIDITDTDGGEFEQACKDLNKELEPRPLNYLDDPWDNVAYDAISERFAVINCEHCGVTQLATVRHCSECSCLLPEYVAPPVMQPDRGRRPKPVPAKVPADGLRRLEFDDVE